MPDVAVLVLEDVHQTLPVVRSLGRSGLHVILGTAAGPRPDAAWSRHIGERWHHPSLDDFEQFSQALSELLAERPDIKAIFPCGEGFRRKAIAHGLTLGVPLVGVQQEVFVACRNKLQANKLADRAGLNVPPTMQVTDLEALETAADSIGYPVIVKPYGNQHSLAGNKAIVVKRSTDLQAEFPRWPEEHDSVLVQQYVCGAVESADFVARRGQLIGYCEATSVRTDNPDGTGFGVLFKSQAPSEDLLGATRSFAEACDYDGPGIIQFIRCARSRDLYFLENNPRLSAGVATSVQWGQDIPLMALETCASGLTDQAHRPFDENANPYRFDSLCYWFQRDITAFVSRRGQLPPRLRRQWARDIRDCLLRADYDVVWQRRDPLPGLLTLGRQLLRKARRALRLG